LLPNLYGTVRVIIMNWYLRAYQEHFTGELKKRTD
jgi:hypothetical protein